ncbi:hypothetical protein TanjilG_21677 [Lupinus angustifolius]|uniref:F-box domain-containing protein n=1 Tax=Lupinus angustifolius TaxID=3871 RepID=A0A1J7GJ24_LUPAN|nr:PREDICTED: F-box protein At1g61340-like [Lupinus angustifolius]OIV94337.1 hypothetical protein TanjilG_21677 [Lupinus angustifolius]
MEFEVYNDARSLRRKRVMVSNTYPLDSNPPLKRMCSGKFTSISKGSLLEALPIDLLVKVLCGADHEDLEQLFNVSKTIREASKMAKRLHFEYSTPKKKTFAFHTAIDMEHVNGFEDIEAPSAPLRKYRSTLNGKNLSSISIVLFG